MSAAATRSRGLPAAARAIAVGLAVLIPLHAALLLAQRISHPAHVHRATASVKVAGFDEGLLGDGRVSVWLGAHRRHGVAADRDTLRPVTSVEASTSAAAERALAPTRTALQHADHRQSGHSADHSHDHHSNTQVKAVGDHRGHAQVTHHHHAADAGHAIGAHGSAHSHTESPAEARPIERSVARALSSPGASVATDGRTRANAAKATPRVNATSGRAVHASAAHAASHGHGVGRHRHDPHDASVMLVAEDEREATRGSGQAGALDLPWATPPAPSLTPELRAGIAAVVLASRPAAHPNTPPLRPPRA